MDSNKFSQYLEQKSLSISHFSSSLQSFFETCYSKYHIGLAPFITNDSLSEGEITYRLNEEIRRKFRIQWHNVGKKGNQKATQRYYAMEDHYPWLKLEQFLILYFYQIKDSKAHPSNRYIAIGLGWLNEKETDPGAIEKALRKVTDNLAILKNYRYTFSIEQKYSYGKKGSYHEIYANWDRIIVLYSSYDPKSEGTIRFRKSIRYRIVSLVHNIKMYNERLNDLIRAQKNRYLKELIQYDSEDFRNTKFLLSYIFDQLRIDIPEDMRNIDHYIANYNHPDLTIRVKTPWVRLQLQQASYLVPELNRKYGINLSILAD